MSTTINPTCRTAAIVIALSLIFATPVVFAAQPTPTPPADRHPYDPPAPAAINSQTPAAQTPAAIGAGVGQGNSGPVLAVPKKKQQPNVYEMIHAERALTVNQPKEIMP